MASPEQLLVWDLNNSCFTSLAGDCGPCKSQRSCNGCWESSSVSVSDAVVDGSRQVYREVLPHDSRSLKGLQRSIVTTVAGCHLIDGWSWRKKSAEGWNPRFTQGFIGCWRPYWKYGYGTWTPHWNCVQSGAEDTFLWFCGDVSLQAKDKTRGKTFWSDKFSSFKVLTKKAELGTRGNFHVTKTFAFPTFGWEVASTNAPIGSFSPAFGSGSRRWGEPYSEAPVSKNELSAPEKIWWLMAEGMIGHWRNERYTLLLKKDWGCKSPKGLKVLNIG